MEYEIIMLIWLCGLSSTQKNLSPLGRATQSSTYHPYVASLAVTGGPTNDFNSGSCSHTGLWVSAAWWMLTLPNESMFIEKIIIYSRSGSRGIDGFSLYLSNTSITGTKKQTPPGHPCYQDVADDKYLNTYTIQCNQLAQGVIIYNDHPKSYQGPALELCDIQVIGCAKTRFGDNCQEECSIKCFDQHCYPSNGSCVWGCNCYDSCNSDKTCTSGCKAGFSGEHCNENNLASDGFPSQFPPESVYPAELIIDGIRLENSCARTSGSIAWLSLDLGKLSIIETIYLIFRNNDAVKQYARNHSLHISNSSETWRDGPVLQMTSDFDNNFPFLTYSIYRTIVGRYIFYEPGSFGGTSIVDICEIEVVGCILGFYGNNCNKICPDNCYGPCDLVTGVCTFGCMDGWTNPSCNQSCDYWKFGHNCKLTCHCFDDTEICDHVTGVCPKGGCMKGWKGTTCSLECGFGQYGFNCNESCNGCVGSRCDPISGKCENTLECNPGWIQDPPFCKNGCSGGLFGENCDIECDTCLLTKCNGFNGSCTYGCINGFFGEKCDAITQQQSEDTTNYTAAVVGGVLATVIIVQAVLIVLLVRRQKICNGSTCESEDPYEMSGEANAGNNSYSTLTMGKGDVTLGAMTQDTENDPSNTENVYEMPEPNEANM